MPRTLLTLLLLLPAGAVYGGWFGPDDADECIQQYAPAASTKRLVGAVYQYCRRGFDPAVSKADRREALCIAEGIPNLKTEHAFRALAEGCENSDPSLF